MARWRTIAPIVRHYRDPDRYLSRPFDLGFGVSIGPMHYWPPDATIGKDFGFEFREDLSGSELALVAEYEADSLGEPDPEAEGRSKQDVALEKLRLANLAIWLAHPSGLGFRMAIPHKDFGEGEFVAHGFETFWHLRALDRYAGNSVFRTSLEEAKKLLQSLVTIGRKGGLWISARSLFKALAEPEAEIRFLLLWVSIEALFGPEDRRNIGNRVSERAGSFIGGDPADVTTITAAVKQSWKWRGAVVHGMRTEGFPEDWQDVILPAEGVLRAALRKILADLNLVEGFSGSRREGFLDSLAPSHDPRTEA